MVPIGASSRTSATSPTFGSPDRRWFLSEPPPEPSPPLQPPAHLIDDGSYGSLLQYLRHFANLRLLELWYSVIPKAKGFFRLKKTFEMIILSELMRYKFQRHFVGQWLWHSWQSGRFQHQKIMGSNPSISNFIINIWLLLTVEKAKIKNCWF